MVWFRGRPAPGTPPVDGAVPPPPGSPSAGLPVDPEPQPPGGTSSVTHEPWVLDLRRHGRTGRRFRLTAVGAGAVSSHAAPHGIPAARPSRTAGVRRPRGQLLASIQLGRGRQPGLLVVGGAHYEVRRAPRLGPFELRADDGRVVAELLASRGLREDAEVRWEPDRRLALTRRRRFGPRELLLTVADGDPAHGTRRAPPTGPEPVGRLWQRRSATQLHTLALPGDVPEEVAALLAWWLAVLATRDLRALTGR